MRTIRFLLVAAICAAPLGLAPAPAEAGICCRIAQGIRCRAQARREARREARSVQLHCQPP